MTYALYGGVAVSPNPPPAPVKSSTEKQIRWALPTAEELVEARFERIELAARIAAFEERHPQYNFSGHKTEAAETL